MVSAGTYWDFANALGYLGLALLLYLAVEAGAGRQQRVHQWLSYSMVVILVGHAALLWVPENSLWNYFTLQGPLYMWAGLLSLAITCFMIIIALPASRRFWHSDYSSFRKLHLWLWIAVLAGALWHTGGSGFYSSRMEFALLIIGVLIFYLLRDQGKLQQARVAPRSLLIAAVVPLLFVGVKAVG